MAALASCQADSANTHQDISTAWQFKATDSDNWLVATVPGVVHTDLLAHRLIPDPYKSTNEDSVQWVEHKKWEYKTEFTITKEGLKYENIDIVFQGLDTYAEVYLNDSSILEAANMFRNWRIPVEEMLVSGVNELRVVFTPPIAKNKALLEQLGYSLPAGSETGDWRVSPFTRKAAYQFGWDFAPRLVTMGIWQPVGLDFWNEARIEDVRFELENLTDSEAKYSVYLTIYATEANTSYQVKVQNFTREISLKAGINSIAIDLTIVDPKLWWPNGLGEAYLYDIPLSILSGNQVIDSVTKHLGIRTIELVQEEDAVGKSFYFIINSEKVFVKGANWSPLSSFPGSVPDSVYINRISSVKEAHMNMLRVWGGGIYERNLFYDLCDENGIMVWQDFMFANSMYPGDNRFLNNVMEEVKQQVLRLQTHPSIALWNGNNEIEVAWKNWGWQQQFGYSVADSSKIWTDYEQLFKQLIPEIVSENDPRRAYTSTSPLSNWGHQDNFKTGSMHYWGVWHGDDSFVDYKTNVGRFMAEYGFQSYPHASTIDYFSEGKELDLQNKAAAHQKSYIGNGLISQEIAGNFGNVLSLQSFLDKSQLTQALAYKIAIEAHRLNKTICGGTLFWQLNDCWPGPSWSVIDYFGHQKLAYKIVKDRYKPVIIIAESQQNDFTISVISDLLINIEASLKIELYRYNNERLWVTTKPVNIKSNVALNVYRSDITKLLDGLPKAEVYLKLTLLSTDEIIDIENFYFVKPKFFKGAYDIIGIN